MWKPWRYGGGAVASLVLGALGATLTAQNGAQFKDWRPAALGAAAQAKPRDTCASLVALTGFEFSVTRAAIVPASTDAPEHCRVSGQILPEVRFEVSLPTVWNGRLYMFGNGGYAGEALDAAPRIATARNALMRGFATAQTNTGHDAASEPLGTFAASPQKFLDYAYRGVHVTVLTAKRILQAYYDGPLRHSVLRRLLDRRPSRPDLGAALPGRLRRHRRRRAGAQLLGDDDRLPVQPARARGGADFHRQAEGPWRCRGREMRRGRWSP